VFENRTEFCNACLSVASLLRRTAGMSSGSLIPKNYSSPPTADERANDYNTIHQCDGQMERQTDMSPNTFKPPLIHTLCWEFYFKGIANISESRRIPREIVILFITERSVGQCYHTTGWTSDRGQLAESLATFSERHF